MVLSFDADATPTGEKETGSYGVDLAYFKDIYKKLFNEEVPNNANYKLLGYGTPIKNNILYGSMFTGRPTTSVIFKANSITLKDKQYELLIDVLEFEDQEDMDNYSSYSIITYDEKLVSYRVKVTYETNNGYVLKSIVAYE